jgi:acyl carrier protein
MVRDTRDAGEIENWIRHKVAEVVNLDPADVGPEDAFEQFGIDSAKSISLVMDLENWLGLDDELPLDILFEATSIRQSALQIFARVQDSLVQSDTALRVTR